MPDELTMLLVHAAATWGMVGLIWFVQVVHYPLMRGVDPSQFGRWADSHQARTTVVVGPLMLIEAASAFVLASSTGLAPESRLAMWLGIGLLAVVWLSTFFVQVPQHAKLSKGFDERAWRLLVSTNWIRTVGWSARGVIAGAVVWMEAGR